MDQRVKFARINKLAEKLGAKILVVSAEELSDAKSSVDFSPCPFRDGIGVCHSAQVVLVDKHFLQEEFWLATLIHELGHVLASKEKPDRSREFDFLGWEIAFARKVRGLNDWIKGNQDYCIDWHDHLEFKELPRNKRKEFFDQRIAVSRRKGMLDANCHPRSIR